jgi:hypothetical protein
VLALEFLANKFKFQSLRRLSYCTRREYGERYTPYPLVNPMVMTGRLEKRIGKRFDDYKK